MATLMDYFNSTGGWIYFLAPLILGMLHGIEPGHSKTNSALVRENAAGQFWGPILLGLAAAASHTMMIWIIASTASHIRSHWALGTVQPYLEIASAFITLGLAVRSFLRLREAHPPQETFPSSIETRSDEENSSTSQILVAGAAIGMLPCPLTLGVLLTCFQSGRLILGMTLAVCFGLGLALSMATAGSVSAWFTRKAKVWHLNVSGLRHRISSLSCLLLTLLAIALAWRATANFLNP